MLRAFSLAIGQLFSGPILTVLGICTVLSVASFMALGFGIYWALGTWLQVESGPLAWLNSLLGSLLGSVLMAVILAWLLFPVITGAFVSLFLDRVARIIERQHYPHLPPAAGVPLAQSLAVSGRFLIVLLAANILLLFLLLVPPVYAIAWFVVNGWLLGREYFEMVAMRRISARGADALRRRRGSEILITGIALAVLLIPPFNLILPIIATAVMVHRSHEWLGTEAESD